MNVYEAFIAEVDNMTIDASASAVEVVGELTRAVKRAQMKVDSKHGASSRLDVKKAVEEWFSNVDLDDLFLVNGWTTEPPKGPEPYNENGDMVTREGQVFRQIGWRIDGGPKDGMLFSANMTVTEEEIRAVMEEPHGGVTPIYVEVGTD